MNRFYFLQIIVLLTAIGCSEQNSKQKSNTLNHSWLDSIIKKSDSSYTRPYKRTDFVTSVFYINKDDSTILQIMKDSADSIRQIIIAKNDIRTFFAQYYANGNLQADLPVDEYGQHHGKAVFYYDDGNLQSSGIFNHGLKTGEWKVYDKKGKITATDTYDKNGQLIPQQHP